MAVSNEECGQGEVIPQSASMMNRSFICCSAFLLFVGARAAAQLPDTCKAPTSATLAPAGTPPARVYDVVGAWFAERGDLKCAVAAFKQALRLEPRSAEAHFDLGLVRQNQQQPAAAISEFRLALQYDPTLLMAHCALGSSDLSRARPRRISIWGSFGKISSSLRPQSASSVWLCSTIPHC